MTVTAAFDGGRRVEPGMLTADRAQPERPVAVAIKPALLGAIRGPGGGELKGDPVADGGRDERAAAPGAVCREPCLEVLGVAEIVPRVMVGTLEVEQVFGRPLIYADVANGSRLSTAQTLAPLFERSA